MAINERNKHDFPDDDYKIVIDEPAKAPPDFKQYAERLSQIIIRSRPQFTVGIFGGWGTGKTTLMRMIRRHLDEDKENFIITIGFDAWRYENEEFSALVPLVRTITLHLEDYIHTVELGRSPKKTAIKNLASKFKRVGEELILNSKVNIGLEYPGAKASVETNIGMALEHYKSRGAFFKNQKKIYFHKHISDHISDELEWIRSKKDTENLKLVIFVDDLDRCTPDRALELLESIKTFFDTEGIIYVIGMDPSTIDPIIKVKYGDQSKVSGLDYMQKIVQLPFQIPVWSEEDLGKTIEIIANETGLPKDITDKLLEHEIKDLIINSAKLNPRNIKRFINSLVLSYSTSGENLKDVRDEKLRSYIIKNYLRSMISVQTFYFRGEKWLRLLKMINNYHERIEFLTHFITVIRYRDISYQDMRDKIKDFPSQTLEIYNEIIDINDEDLFHFLRDASIPLLRIDKIENYLRSVDTKDIYTAKSTKITSYESLDKLMDGIESFNEYVQGSYIHLPYLDISKPIDNAEFHLKSFWDELSGSKLMEANLFGAYLSEANLSGANLSEANLSGANLSEANLSGSMLSGANLSGANLSGTDLSEANISGANLQQANLTKANISGANLKQANISGTDLSEANISGANLQQANLTKANISGANLHQANLIAANLSGANLSGTDLSKTNLQLADLSKTSLQLANLSEAYLNMTNLSGANLSGVRLLGAMLSRADLSGANIFGSIIIEPRDYEDMKLDVKSSFKSAICDRIDFIYYVSKFTVNIPNFVANKEDLRSKLEGSFNKERLNSILEMSRLPGL